MRLFLLIILAVALGASAATPPTPPAQPANGPGGAAAPHREVKARAYGTGGTAYWLFEPAGPAPDHAPVVVFGHGWGALAPRPYADWIDHIVRRGNVVVFPSYQADLRTPPQDFTPNAATAVKDALERLSTDADHVKPERDHVAFVGHSMGGVVVANLAARADGLPVPKAVMCVEPGKTWGDSPRANVKLDDLSRIAPETLLVTVVGDQDQLARDVDARRIFNEAKRVPAANKSYVVVVSDDHGQPPLVANHFFPIAPGERYGDVESAAPKAGPLRNRLRQRERARMASCNGGDAPMLHRGSDALDFYGTWKLFDALTDAAFTGKNRDTAFGNTEAQRFMGKWSDGVPVKELRVVEHP